MLVWWPTNVMREQVEPVWLFIERGEQGEWGDKEIVR
jgi:hypothetical protein